MKIYLNALIETMLIMLIIGVVAVALIWLLMQSLHAPHAGEFGGEAVAVIATCIAAGFFFRMSVQTEKEIAKNSESLKNHSEG